MKVVRKPSMGSLIAFNLPRISIKSRMTRNTLGNFGTGRNSLPLVCIDFEGGSL